MQLTHAALVIVDISGYTRFITHRAISLVHAEQIVSELMESVIDRAVHPLAVNKLEGDAALLFARLQPNDASAHRDVLAQVGSLFDAFDARRKALSSARSGCPCDACTHTLDLELKAFVHSGEIVVKQVRQFEELAGEPVIYAHRLMKNTVPGNRYALVSEAFVRAGAVFASNFESHRESLDGFGDSTLWLADPAVLPRLPALPTVHAAPTPRPEREPTWRHFPGGERPGLLALARDLARLKLGGLFGR
jgi:class 3 adenylate cyclase